MKLKEAKYLLVDESVLPASFPGVVNAKKLLSAGEAKNVSEAIKMAGISRSVYYKYKDAVFYYEKVGSGGITTFQALLMDKPGVLMSLLSEFYAANANILTVNQNIPVSGRASVSISAQTAKLNRPMEELLTAVLTLPGVLKMESISDI